MTYEETGANLPLTMCLGPNDSTKGDRSDDPVWAIGEMKRRGLDFFGLPRTG
jgi:hypothetical protein